MPRRRLSTAPDDQPLYVLKRDVSGGMNTRQHEQMIEDNQAVLLQNILLETAGSRELRSGQTRIDTAYPSVSSSGYGLFGFDPDGGTFELLAIQSTNLSGAPIGAGWPATATFSNYKTNFTASLQTTLIKAGQSGQNDIVLISNGTDNVFAMYQDHTMHDLGNTNTSPPRTIAIAYYMNRVWTLLNNLASFSDAFPADYSAAFDRTTNAFRIPVGTAKAIIPTRDQGLIFLGADQIWQLSPSVVPAPTTDFPQKILDIGCVNGYTAVQVADDILFLAPDGIRGLFRTALDKLQTGQSFPLSYILQDQFNDINWQHIDKACAVFFDNKYIIALPTGTSTYNNICWVYYPALSTSFYAPTNTGIAAAARSWVIYEGWNIARFAKIRVNGQEILHGIDAVTGQAYQMFSGTSDNGSAIVYDEISKAEDFKAPMQLKYGGEYKVRVAGGNGTLVISANADGLGWVQLGTLDLALTGVTFPVTFPVAFSNASETSGMWHLDDAGIQNFRRCKFEIYCATPNAVIQVIENLATCFPQNYISEDTTNLNT